MESGEVLRRVFSHSAEVQFIGFSPYNSIAVAPTKTEGWNSLTVATTYRCKKCISASYRQIWTSQGTYSGTVSETLQCNCFLKKICFPKCNESIFFVIFFAVKAKSFYGQCLVTLLNKRICSECGVFCVSLCISKLSCCLLFSLSWISSALTSHEKCWHLCMGEILFTCLHSSHHQ